MVKQEHTVCIEISRSPELLVEVSVFENNTILGFGNMFEINSICIRIEKTNVKYFKKTKEKIFQIIVRKRMSALRQHP